MANEDYTNEELAALAGVTIKDEPMSAFDMAKDFGRGVLETPIALGSGIGMSALGGLKGYKSLFDSYLQGIPENERMAKAADIVNDTTSRAYQPKTHTGQFMQMLSAEPIRWGSEKLGQAGEYVGSLFGKGLEGEAIGQASLPIAMTLYGGKQTLDSARSVPSIQKDLVIKNKDPYLFEQRNIKKAGNDIGLIAPAESGVKKTLSNFADANNVLSLKNTETATGRLAEQVGMKKGAILDSDISNRIYELTRAYDKVEKTLPTDIKIPTPFKAKVNELLLPMKERIAQDPQAFAGYDGAIKLLEQQLNQEKITPSILMDKIKKLRSDARNYNKNPSGKPIETDLADASIKLANIYEDLVESELGNKTMLLDNFRKARTQLSQIHIIDQARKADGLVDMQKLAGVVGKYGADKKMVTGDLKTIADFANTFRDVSKPIEQAGLQKISRWEAMADIGAVGAAVPTGGLSMLATIPTISRAVIPSLATKGHMQSSPPSYLLPAIGKASKQAARGLVPIANIGADISIKSRNRDKIDSSLYSDEELLNIINSQGQQ